MVNRPGRVTMPRSAVMEAISVAGSCSCSDDVTDVLPSVDAVSLSDGAAAAISGVAANTTGTSQGNFVVIGHLLASPSTAKGMVCV